MSDKDGSLGIAAQLFHSYEANLVFTGSDLKMPLIYHRDPVRW